VHAALSEVKNVSFHRIPPNHPRYLAAKALAVDAAARRAREQDATSETGEGEPEDDLKLVDDSEWLFQRAMSKDP
jgi:hypothetical protein